MCEAHNLGYLSIQDNTYKKYYIAIKESILSRFKETSTANVAHVAKLSPGMLVEELKTSERENFEDLIVRVYPQNKSDQILYGTEWKCHRIDLLPISKQIWHLLCPISNFEERLRLAKDKEFCQDVEKIKINSKILYSPDNCRTSKYLASVESIGEVKELGDGYYFGLHSLSNPDIYKYSSSNKVYYKNCESIGIFAKLNNISFPNKNLDGIKTFERNFLAGDILQPKKSDNYFVKNKENVETIDKKKNIDLHQKDKDFLHVDTHNNNQSTKFKEPFVFNTFNQSLEQGNEIKRDHVEKIPKHNHQTSHIGPLNTGSCVKVLADNSTHNGVVRWIELDPKSMNFIAGIELESIHPQTTVGTYENTRCIEHNPQETLFIDSNDYHQYNMAASRCYYKPEIEDFEFIQNSFIDRIEIPILVKDIEKICGKNRGIQGHHNSCYLDATLFSMFAFTCAFDSLLFRPVNEADCPEYEEVQRVLREEIVNPLRKDLYVGADRVMKLRTLLEKSSSVSGLTCDEKDPEEFLTSLVAQTLKAEPYLKLSSGQDTYHYQLFVEKDDQLTFPTVQQLLEQSFLTSDIKLKEVPSILILQMPRFGKSYKMYSKIKPSLSLDVTDIIEDSARQCAVCGELAKYECRDCYRQSNELQSISFCKSCSNKVHSHEKRSNNHHPKRLNVSPKYEYLKDVTPIPRLCLELLAVVCIETSHYVSFVKSAPGDDAPWCFFDSMADRKGEQDGYNIPEIVPLSNFSFWLTEDGVSAVNSATDDRHLPEHAKRLFCDAYMYMYQSSDTMMCK